jgi:hypothetical protein
VPSLGLLLEGKVTVEPGALVAAKLAKATSAGATIIANNGGSLISDNGLGLISDNGLGLIANNGGNYRVAAAASGLKPIEGMWVKAVSLFDGKVLAGPVATRADGSYKLGFLKVPAHNLRIVASVPGQESGAQFSYATFVPPSPAPVVTSDTTQAVAKLMIDSVAILFQPLIDKCKQEPVPSPNPNNPQVALDLAYMLIKAGPAMVTAVDKDGAIARGIAERLIASADLTNPAYKELYDVAEEARAVGDALPTPPTDSVVVKVTRLLEHKEDQPELIALFVSLGLPETQATDLATRLRDKSKAVSDLLTLTMITHQKELLDPLEAQLK